MNVPNQQPSSFASYRIAIVGEAPGRDEEAISKPFMGMSGRFLKALMSRAGINPESCLIANVCQTRPIANDITTLRWDGDEITDGLALLKEDVVRFKPNIVFLLGNIALKAAKDMAPCPLKKPKHSVSNWRGYAFICDQLDSPFFGLKCIASYHPAAILRNYEWAPLLQFDLKKAFRHGTFPDLRVPKRELDVHLTPQEIIEALNYLNAFPKTVAIDIEGGVENVSCISFATDPGYAFIVPLSTSTGSFYENEKDEIQVWQALSKVLANPQVGKILQNSLYDRFVLQYSLGIVVRGVIEDTMLKHWEAYCELEKGLGFQTSLYTDEPYYKFERKTDDLEVFHRYCCKDSAITYEIAEKITPSLKAPSLAHYRINLELLNPILYMELRGIAYNTKGAKLRQKEVQEKVWELQHGLNNITGHQLPIEELLLPIQAQKLMCYKRDPNQPKAPYATAYPETLSLIRLNPRTSSQQGHLEDLLETSLNTNSSAFRTYLYDKLKLPLQTNELGQPTADYGALLNLKKKLPPESLDHRVADLAIQIRHHSVRARMLEIHADRDGRIRCGYNVVGTETGRITCYTSPTGSGYNLQTIPTYDRDLFVADQDCWFFQCDLSGADGWTVAAYCKMLGDSTMLDDLIFGLKPAKILCLMLRQGASMATKSREELSVLAKEVKKEDWDYFACKIAQHGTCYLMGGIKLARTIFEQSEGKVNLTSRQTEELRSLFFLRYPGVRLWHDYTARQLSRQPVITSASGHRRVFFGRSKEILSDALAHEPQHNTTYVTNLAALRLWHDPENRESDRLKIEPLHQVHDALAGQFKKSDTAWAVGKIREYFNNSLKIANQQVVIPFEGSYGGSWGSLKEGVI